MKDLTPPTRMPAENRLAMPVQNLSQDYHDVRAPGILPSRAALWRLATFVPAVLTTLALIAAFTDWFSRGGLDLFEVFLIGMIAITFFWISLSVSTVTVGVINLLRGVDTVENGDVTPQTVALLVPAYNEVPWDVFGNAQAMLLELDGIAHQHDYALFFLSIHATRISRRRNCWPTKPCARSFPITSNSITADGPTTRTARPAILPIGWSVGAAVTMLCWCSTLTV